MFVSEIFIFVTSQFLDIEIDKLKKAIDKVFNKDSNISYIKMSKDMVIEKYCIIDLFRFFYYPLN